MSEFQNVAVPKCRVAKMTVADLSTAKMSSAILSVNPSWPTTVSVIGLGGEGDGWMDGWMGECAAHFSSRKL